LISLTGRSQSGGHGERGSSGRSGREAVVTPRGKAEPISSQRKSNADPSVTKGKTRDADVAGPSEVVKKSSIGGDSGVVGATGQEEKKGGGGVRMTRRNEGKERGRQGRWPSSEKRSKKSNGR